MVGKGLKRGSKKGRLTASLEDYLEAIYWLEEQNRVARAGEIAKLLGVGKSAVSAALKNLSQMGYVNYDPYSFVTLTDKGRSRAEGLVRKHSVIKRFFVEFVGIEDSKADSIACQIEHVVDDDTLRRLLEFMADCRDT